MQFHKYQMETKLQMHFQIKILHSKKLNGILIVFKECLLQWQRFGFWATFFQWFSTKRSFHRYNLDNHFEASDIYEICKAHEQDVTNHCNPTIKKISPQLWLQMMGCSHIFSLILIKVWQYIGSSSVKNPIGCRHIKIGSRHMWWMATRLDNTVINELGTYASIQLF